MRKSLQLSSKISETRQFLNEFSGIDTPSEEQLAEAEQRSSELSRLEREYRVALVVESQQEERETRQEPDTEQRELINLAGRVSVGRYLGAALEQRAADGAELEFNQALGLPSNHLPLSVLAPVEKRTTTDVDTVQTPQRWLDRLFAGTAADRLGITFESVAPGVPVYPVTTAGGAPVQRAREQAAAASAWTIGTSDLKPKRRSVFLEFTSEDAARLPGLEAALMRDIRMAMTATVDKAVFVGDDAGTGTDSDIVGLTTAAISESTITQANKVKAAETLSVFTGMVDGVHAESLSDLRVVATVGAYKLWASTFANSAVSNETLSQFLANNSLPYSVRGDIEDDTTNGKYGAFVGRGRGIEGAGVVAVWAGAELIRDNVSQAKSGKISLTLSYLWDFGLPRTDSFRRVKFVT